MAKDFSKTKSYSIDKLSDHFSYLQRKLEDIRPATAHPYNYVGLILQVDKAPSEEMARWSRGREKIIHRQLTDYNTGITIKL